MGKYDDWDLDVPDDDFDDWDYKPQRKPEPDAIRQPKTAKQSKAVNQPRVIRQPAPTVERIEAEVVETPPPITHKRPPGIQCPRCHERNISFQIVETGSNTSRSGTGLGGNTYNLIRLMIGLCTCGIGFFIMPRAQGSNKTKTKLIKMALCQNCGYSWTVH
jgi:DNA-directed RNA polymerase subunit M/transcription elongation factor TFIIS